LNRPERANTISDTLLEGIGHAVARANADDEVRVLLVTGAGRSFCGGADLRDLSLQRISPSNPNPRIGIEFDLVEKPVIAAINGAAFGGGCEMALTCDFRFMSRTAKIGLPEINFGGLPAAGGTIRLPRLIGASAARRLIMTGEPLSAEAALAIGLVDEVVDSHDLIDACLAFAEKLAEKAPFAIRTAKRLVREGSSLPLDAALLFERAAIAAMATPAEMKQARADAAARSEVYARVFSKSDD
jgi:enoyl-CoA hydratase/carnithine racemase